MVISKVSLVDKIGIVTMDIMCWRCEKPTTVVLGIVRKINQAFIKLEECGDYLSTTMLSNKAVLQSLNNVGRIAKRSSRIVKVPYWSNGCFHCNVIQGSNPLWQTLQDRMSLGNGVDSLTHMVGPYEVDRSELDKMPWEEFPLMGESNRHWPI